jgi:hypothetical protein
MAVKCLGIGEGLETIGLGRNEDSGFVPKRMGSNVKIGVACVFLLLV